MTNVSHTVNHLWFVDNRKELKDYMSSSSRSVTRDILPRLHPMEKQQFTTWKQHQAPQHHLAVIPTVLEDSVWFLVFCVLNLFESFVSFLYLFISFVCLF